MPAMFPLRTALLCQLLGGFVAAAGIQIIYPKLFGEPAAWALVQGACAALVSHKLAAPRWWTAIHLIFFPLVVAAIQLGVPPLAWLGAFLLLYLVFWRTDKDQVPLYLSNRRTAMAVEGLLPREPSSFIDLGCGTASLLCHLAKARPDSSFVGVEHAPLPFLVAWLRSRRIPNLSIRYGDFWHENLAAHQVAYAFLSPAPMKNLWRMAARHMPSSGLLISNSFEVPGIAPGRTVEVPDRRRTRLLCYWPGAARSESCAS